MIQNPSLAEVMRPGPLPEFSIGREDAPVTIIQYASLTCPFCKRFQAEVYPVLKRDYIDTGKVRYMIREFPIGKTSGMATIALRCAPMTRISISTGASSPPRRNGWRRKCGSSRSSRSPRWGLDFGAV